MCIFIIILLYASITVFQRKPVSRRSYYGKTRVFRVILLLPIEIGRIIFLPIDRCGEGDGAGDVEVVGEGAAVYLFGQAVVAGREVEQADMAIDGSGAVGGYGAQDGGETEVLGEWNLLPVAVSLALDGVLLSVAHIVVVGIDEILACTTESIREMLLSMMTRRRVSALVTVSVLSVGCSASATVCRAVGRQEANARVAIRRKRGFAWFILLIFYYEGAASARRLTTALTRNIL